MPGRSLPYWSICLFFNSSFLKPGKLLSNWSFFFFFKFCELSCCGCQSRCLMSWAPDSWWWRQSEAFSRQQCGQVLKGLEHKDDSPSADQPTEWSGSCSTKWQMFCCSNISRSELVKLVQESFMARFLFVRKGVKLSLLVLLADLRHPASGWVWHSPWRFALWH